MVVIFFVGLDDLGGAVGGVVVDDDYLVVGGSLGKEGLECGLDAVGIVIDWDDDGYSLVFCIGHNNDDVSKSVDMPVQKGIGWFGETS